MQSKTQQGLELISQFEFITERAELKALSNISLERPLNDSEFNRMRELKKEVGL